VSSPRRSLGIALVVLGVVPLLLGLAVSGPYLWGRSAEGRVIRVVRVDRDTCRPVVGYVVDAKPYEMESQVGSSPCGWSEGEPVTVRFLDGSPADGYLVSFSTTLPLGLLGLLGIGFVVAGLRRATGSPDEAKPTASATAPVRLADAPLGRTVTVQGVFRMHTELRAPLSGEACGAWKVLVRRPLVGEEGELVCWAAAVRPFELDDGEATLEVPSRMTIQLELEPTSRGRVRHEPAPKLAELLRSRGKDAIDADPTQNDYDWSEGIVRDGDVVTLVVAVERAASSDDAAYRAGRRRLVAAVPSSGAIVVRTARPAPPPTG
jgi:hypothetical protein